MTLKEVPNNCCECDEVIYFSRENICQVFVVVNSCFFITFKYLRITDPAVSMNIRPYNPVLLTPFSRNNLEKLIHVLVLQLAKKYPMFLGIWRFMIVFTIAYSWCLYRTRWILSTDRYPVRFRSILLLPYNLHLHVICRHLPAGFLTEATCHFASVYCMQLAPPISSTLILSPIYCLARRTNHNSPHTQYPQPLLLLAS